MQTQRPFSGRALTSLVTAGLFAVMTVSGIVLFLMPSGRVAHRTDWHLALLDRWQWTALHSVTAVLFVAAVVWHLALNWKTFLAHLRSRLGGHVTIRREAALAAALVAAVITGTLAEVAPFAQIVDLNLWLRHAWTVDGGGGPPPARPR
ncbi:DUF4405 domain-containing protein [Azospirillum sp. A39]|uniref:DUF4405 domain-containing protein n=1 Tax=Azospirillum sp. A39 TaxID=3462279 RepID=UPI004045CA76